VGELWWPEVEEWSAELRKSPVVAAPEDYAHDPFLPLVWDGHRLYLQRYWHFELTIADDLRRRADDGTHALRHNLEANGVLDLLFPPHHPDEPDLQRVAVQRALTNRVSVIAGGPGTGKTRTIAALMMMALAATGPDEPAPQIALAAPTGKAAARMTEAVKSEVLALTSHVDVAFLQEMPEATTLHRLLGWAPGTAFRHHRQNPLPFDMVIVDETSMVSLQLMARLLEAMRDTAQLVLVGDPFQLASIEAGSVLSDVVGPTFEADAAHPLHGRVTTLRRQHRFGAGSAIAALADAVRDGHGERAMEILESPDPTVRWIRPDDTASRQELRQTVARHGADMVAAALAGDAERGMVAATSLKVLCATRRGDFGLYQWSDQIESDVAALIPELDRLDKWYVGRPIMVTANDPVNKVANGDVGLVVREDDSMVIAIPDGTGFRKLPPSRLDRVESWWAMTIHKSQGSEFRHAVLSLPNTNSPILTRELLYTGVTRAKENLTVVASASALALAIGRPIARASGLRDRLWPGLS
jgi:exodeoxyribonuclease V alpha subunit